MDRKIPLTSEELSSIKCGEAITMATVLAIMIIAILTVVVYKLFGSSDGSVALPGGYKFTRK
ncbi:MAG: hypothetical protein ACI4UG_05660 [Candidatus Onthovivens sp.]